MEISNTNINGTSNQVDVSRSLDQKVEKSDVQVRDVQSTKADEKKDAKNPADLKKAVDLANKALFKNNTHLKFQIHEKTKEVMVKIINDETGEVVKEIPPEKMLDMVAKLWEIAGILIDERR